MRTKLVIAVTLMSISLFYFLSQVVVNDRKVASEVAKNVDGHPKVYEKSIIVSSQSRSSLRMRLTQTTSSEPQKESQSSAVPQISNLELSLKQKEFADRHFSAINDRLAKEPNSKVTDVMEELFNEEPLDHAWASENEKKIYNFFRDAEDFKNFSPEFVGCKSSSCKVTIASTDPAVSEQIRFAISRRITQTASDIPPSYTSVIDPERATLTIYFQKGPM